MSRPSRPSFLNTKGDRRRLGRRIDVDSIEQHYRDMLRGEFIYTGLPSDCPTGFIDADALWFYPGVSMKRIKGYKELGVFPCSPVLLDIYGRPTKWMPIVFGWAVDGKDAVPDGTDIFKESDAPVLWLNESYRDRVLPYLQVMSRALTALGNNVSAQNTPTIITGVAGNPGDNVGALMLENELMEGSTYIPVVDPRGGNPLGVQAVSLGIPDVSQNLISTISFCDTQIKAILGLETNIQKSSGIGAFDAKGVGGLATDSDAQLQMRKDWVGRLNDLYGTDITVERNDTIDKTIQFTGMAVGGSGDPSGFEDS